MSINFRPVDQINISYFVGFKDRTWQLTLYHNVSSNRETVT
jgi:hypothetical protein